MRNIALRLRYDGSRYHGWQVQKNDVSVCSTVQDALAKICEHPVKLTGCGRTDAGVHALRYCANFRTDCRIPIDRFALAANSRLPLTVWFWAIYLCATDKRGISAKGLARQLELSYESAWYLLVRIRRAMQEHDQGYLLWVLQNAPQLSETDEAWAEKLLPANAPEECYMPQK